MKYQVRYATGRVLSSHATLKGAGKAALKHNTTCPHYTDVVGVRHEKHGDVTGPAFMAAVAPPQPRLPRSVQSRKHPKGADEIDKLLHSFRAPSKRSAGRSRSRSR